MSGARENVLENINYHFDVLKVISSLKTRARLIVIKIKQTPMKIDFLGYSCFNGYQK